MHEIAVAAFNAKMKEKKHTTDKTNNTGNTNDDGDGDNKKRNGEKNRNLKLGKNTRHKSRKMKQIIMKNVQRQQQ